VIVKMLKVYIVARRKDRDRLLQSLRALGVVHLAPVDPPQAVPDEETVAAIANLERAMQVLANVEPAGEAPQLDAVDAAREVLDIQRRSAERRHRLGVLYRQLEQLVLWGDVELKQFEQLRDAGIDVRFFCLPADKLDQVQAECVQPITALPGKELLVAVIDRRKEPVLPEEARSVPLPQRDAPSIRAEAAEIDALLKQDASRLAQLAHLTEAMQRRLAELRSQAEYIIASRSGLDSEHLFALQGWVPQPKADNLSTGLVQAGLDAAVEVLQPAEDEQPPTLIQYPRWAAPIAGLFEILGTLPGYREMDPAGFFMIALPLFAAILIGDAGYGLIFLAIPLLFYRRLVGKLGKPKTHLLAVVGAATLAWGVLSANYFGLTPDALAESGWTSLSEVMTAVAPLWDTDPEKVRLILIKLSFIIGCVHLSLARLSLGLWIFPDSRSLAQIGWAVFLWGMLGLIWLLFFGPGELPVPMPVVWAALAVGAVLVVVFTSPHRNPAKRIGIGVAASLLPALGTFSDTMSYIRLMAVGLATYYIASAFNGLGAAVADAATWFAAAPILLFGHALNIGLAVIAIFAHGVRLNMLEFSNNAGIQWSGYPYTAFAEHE